MKQPCLLLWLLFLWLRLPVSAQESTGIPKQPPPAIIKLAPLCLLDPDNTIQAGLEIHLSRQMSIQAEFGYGTGPQLAGFGPSPWTPNAHVRGKEVWRIRSELRYYTRLPGVHIPERFPHCGSYIAIEGLYKRVNVALLDTLQARETIDPAFARAPVSRHVIALHGKIGAQTVLDYDSNSFLSRFIIDAYIGAGIRYISVVENGVETSLVFQNTAIYNRFQYSAYRPGDRFWQPGFSVGVKIDVSL